MRAAPAKLLSFRPINRETAFILVLGPIVDDLAKGSFHDAQRLSSPTDGTQRLMLRGVRTARRNRRFDGWPDDRLRNDDALPVEGGCGRTIELVAKGDGIADTAAERGVVNASEQAIRGETVGWLLHGELADWMDRCLTFAPSGGRSHPLQQKLRPHSLYATAH